MTQHQHWVESILGLTFPTLPNHVFAMECCRAAGAPCVILTMWPRSLARGACSRGDFFFKKNPIDTVIFQYISQLIYNQYSTVVVAASQ